MALSQRRNSITVNEDLVDLVKGRCNFCGHRRH